MKNEKVVFGSEVVSRKVVELIAKEERDNLREEFENIPMGIYHGFVLRDDVFKFLSKRDRECKRYYV